MGLQPMYINLYATHAMYEYCEEKLNVRDCIECGACAYKCPGRIPLVQTIRLVKQKLGPAKKK
jgi:electron transport complex protein RnfC